MNTPPECESHEELLNKVKLFLRWAKVLNPIRSGDHWLMIPPKQVLILPVAGG